MDLNVRTLTLLKGEKCEKLKWEILFVGGEWDYGEVQVLFITQE